MENDRYLYENFLNGNKKAFENLMMKYKNNLLYFISKFTKNIDKAEDIFQEVILFILENKEYYDFKYSFKTYIYMLAKSKSMNYIKHEKIIENIDDKEEELREETILEEIVLSKERKKKIQNVMSKLSNDYQLVLYLTGIEGLSYRETALIMEKSEKQIKNLSFNARKKLRKLMIKEKVVEMKNNRIIRLVMFFTIISVLTSGIVFAKDITSFLKNIFGLHTGINSAIKNNYIEKGNEEYITSNDVKSKIEYVLLDDYKLCISLRFELLDTGINENITNLEIPNLVIYDENENILFKQFLEENDYSFFNISTLKENGQCFGGSYDFYTNKENNNIYILTYIINSEEFIFPKSQKIYVKFNKIDLINKNNISSDELAKLGFKEIREKTTIGCVNGEWELELDLSEKTYNRESAIYKIKNFDEFDFDIPSELIITKTESRFKMTHYFDVSKEFINIDTFKEPYIENENGEKFEHIISDVALEKDKMTYEYWFQLSSFDVTDNMKIVFTLEDNTYMILDLEKHN